MPIYLGGVELSAVITAEVANQHNETKNTIWLCVAPLL
jgi:hypothetical protein